MKDTLKICLVIRKLIKKIKMRFSLKDIRSKLIIISKLSCSELGKLGNW